MPLFVIEVRCAASTAAAAAATFRLFRCNCSKYPNKSVWSPRYLVTVVEVLVSEPDAVVPPSTTTVVVTSVQTNGVEGGADWSMRRKLTILFVCLCLARRDNQTRTYEPQN